MSLTSSDTLQHQAGSIMAPPTFINTDFLHITATDQGQGAIMASPNFKVETPLPFQVTKRDTGRRRCLFIGIDYNAENKASRSGIADAMNVKSFLISQYNVPANPESMRLMTDEPANKGTPRYPSRENIVQSLKWLVEGSLAGDVLFLHYSGAGGQKANYSGEETSGFNQTIVPLDAQQSGPILDNELNEILVQSLSAGVRLTCLFDCSHSGSILDLPVRYTGSRMNPIYDALLDVSGQAIRLCGSLALVYLKDAAIKYLTGGLGPLMGAAIFRTPADAQVICFSSCLDAEFSADICFNDEECFGAMSHTFVRILREHPSATYKQIMNKAARSLATFNQTPCLSSNMEVNMDQPFEL